MATTQTIINVHDGRVSMTVLGETVKFKVSNAMLSPVELNDNCAFVEVIDACVESQCDREFSQKKESLSYLHEGNVT